MKRRFTVIGFYEDNGQIFAEHVRAEDWTDAVVKAGNSMCARNDATTPEERDDLLANMNLISVLSGWRDDLNECDSVSAFCDQPGLEPTPEE